jgi:antagonist of KipI
MGIATVLKAGIFSSIQDSGRRKYRQYGVPIGGYLDSESAKYANIILGNQLHDAVLEMSYSGVSLKFSESTSICLTGADCDILLDGQACALYQKIIVMPGQTLEVGVLRSGIRTYMAVLGGWQTQTVLGSKSYHPLLGMEKIQRESKLAYISNAASLFQNQLKIAIKKHWLQQENIELFPGPEYEVLLNPSELEELPVIISPNSNRMATVIDQIKLEALEQEAMISSPVAPGIVQLYPNGSLCVLMRDSQTVGGYPRIAYTNEQGLNFLAQKRAGERIHFRWAKPSASK